MVAARGRTGVKPRVAAPRTSSSGGMTMASQDHIRNPIEWGWGQVKIAALTVGSLGRSLRGGQESRLAPLPTVRRIEAADLREALARGFSDLGADRTDVTFLCCYHPVRGILLARLHFGRSTRQMRFSA